MKKLSYKASPKIRILRDVIDNRFSLVTVMMFLIFSIIILTLFNIQVIKNKHYSNLSISHTEKIIEGRSSPRGRIYDRNHKILVDNTVVKTIYYSKSKNITKEEEIALAYLVSQKINLDYQKIALVNLKEFWLDKYPKEARALITSEEYRDLELRKLNASDLYSLKLNRITSTELDSFTEEDKKAAYLYYLMNKGYSYDEKIIKNINVSEEEYAYIAENMANLKGFYSALDWQRYYPYNDTFKTILGRVSSENQGIPSELKDAYLAKGYKLNDRVGISYLEYIYEDILKGEKAKYRVLNDNSLELISEGKRGNDIVLSIDIDLQRAVDEIITKEIIAAKSEPNTEYYNKSYVSITNPQTGEILALSGRQVIKHENDYAVYDYSLGTFTSPVIVGSVIKAASLAVGYKYQAIDIGTVFFDQCIKIAATPLKCSWREGLGALDDTTALIWSSNSYQFQTAMKVANANYQYNMPLAIDENAFTKYREVYNQYGLGVPTGIDLPNESLGYKGNSPLSGHLLDFSMGQYDTYTTIQLSQYMNTIASLGTRYKLNLYKESYDSTVENLTKVVQTNSKTILNKVDLDEKYSNRLVYSLAQVMQGSLGYGYMGKLPMPAGKTGTSQSFFDSDGDNKIDKETITTTFAGFAPYNDPKVSITCVSPDVSHVYGINYQTLVNKRICSQVSNKYFELYPY